MEEIPSDTGSITSEAPSEDDIDWEEPAQQSSLHEEENEMDSEMNLEIPEMYDETPQPIPPSQTDPDSDDSEENIPLAKFLNTWTQEARHANKPEAFDNTGAGPNVPDDVETPLDVFLTLFNNDLLEKIAFETNLYATQTSNGRQFIPTNHDEVKCFLGINLMGLTKKPSYKDYWSSKLQMRDP